MLKLAQHNKLLLNMSTKRRDLKDHNWPSVLWNGTKRQREAEADLGPNKKRQRLLLWAEPAASKNYSQVFKGNGGVWMDEVDIATLKATNFTAQDLVAANILATISITTPLLKANTIQQFSNLENLTLQTTDNRDIVLNPTGFGRVRLAKTTDFTDLNTINSTTNITSSNNDSVINFNFGTNGSLRVNNAAVFAPVYNGTSTTQSVYIGTPIGSGQSVEILPDGDGFTYVKNGTIGEIGRSGYAPPVLSKLNSTGEQAAAPISGSYRISASGSVMTLPINYFDYYGCGFGFLITGFTVNNLNAKTIGWFINNNQLFTASLQSASTQNFMMDGYILRGVTGFLYSYTLKHNSMTYATAEVAIPGGGGWNQTMFFAVGGACTTNNDIWVKVVKMWRL